MNKKNVVIFCLFFCLCSPPSNDGIVSLSDNTTTTTAINIEDYPVVLAQCLNKEQGYNITTPFDIEDLKSTISQLSNCLLYTSPSPRDATLSRMPSSA